MAEVFGEHKSWMLKLNELPQFDLCKMNLLTKMKW